MVGAREPQTLFTVWDTPVRVHSAVLANLLSLWGVLSWLAGRRAPERPWPLRLLIGAASTAALVAADLGHALAHIVSARYAGAPVDEIVVSAGMPRTLYADNDVPPRIHRLRALGGPVLNAAGLLVSLVLRPLAPRGSPLRAVVDWSCAGHGLLLAGSLAPLPMVDGGTLLKWTLVERGQTPGAADETVRQVDLAIGAAATAAGVALAARRSWLPAQGLAAAGGVAIAAALGKIR